MRRGATLIELVFAIVIIAIASMAVPTMVSQITRSNELAIKQELIYNAKSVMNRIMALDWDSAYKAIPQANGGCGGMLNAGCFFEKFGYDKNFNIIRLRTTGGNDIATFADSGNTITANATQKDKFGLGAGCVSYGINNPDPAAGTNTYNDVDDYDKATFNLDVSTYATGSVDYLLNSKVTTQVDYIQEQFIKGNYTNSSSIEAVLSTTPNNVNTSNIKMITVRSEDVNDASNSFVIFRSYAFNSGYTRPDSTSWFNAIRTEGR